MKQRAYAHYAWLTLLVVLQSGCARTAPSRAPLAPAFLDYVYTAPAAGTIFELEASSEGLGTVTHLQGTEVGGPILPEKISQLTALECTETVLTTDADGPSTTEVTCKRGETIDGTQTKQWVTTEPVQLVRAGGEVNVRPATLSEYLQLKYKRLFGLTLFTPPWAAMLVGPEGSRFWADRDTPLALESTGLFLGETSMLTMTKASARLRTLTTQTAELAFHGVSTRPYDGEFTGTLTIDRATGWLVASSLTAEIRGEDVKTGFVLELNVSSKMSRTHKHPVARRP